MRMVVAVVLILVFLSAAQELTSRALTDEAASERKSIRVRGVVTFLNEAAVTRGFTKAGAVTMAIEVASSSIGKPMSHKASSAFSPRA